MTPFKSIGDKEKEIRFLLGSCWLWLFCNVIHTQAEFNYFETCCFRVVGIILSSHLQVVLRLPCRTRRREECESNQSICPMVR
jgi:hypothetical protein